MPTPGPPPRPPPIALQQARLATLAKLGRVDDRIPTRNTAVRATTTGTVELVPWPSLALGRLRLVHRPGHALLCTDGLSDPWDPDLHEAPPAFRFGCELALEIPHADEAAPLPPWTVALLLGAANWLVSQRFDLRTRVRAHRCLTMGMHALPGLESWVAPNGYHGLLIGVPLFGELTGAQAVIARDGDDPIWLLTAKLLHPLEYAWALGIADSSRAVALAQAFMQQDRHVTNIERASIVPA